MTSKTKGVIPVLPSLQNMRLMYQVVFNIMQIMKIQWWCLEFQRIFTIIFIIRKKGSLFKHISFYIGLPSFIMKILIRISNTVEMILFSDFCLPEKFCYFLSRSFFHDMA